MNDAFGLKHDFHPNFYFTSTTIAKTKISRLKFATSVAVSFATTAKAESFLFDFQ